MADAEVNHLYNTWPEEPTPREQVARDVVGEHFIDAYDSWVSLAHQMLHEGYHMKAPSDEQRAFLDWIATLSAEERNPAFEFVRFLLSGVVFSILAHIDGVSGCVLQDTHVERIRILLDVGSRQSDPLARPVPVETIPVNGEDGVELHQEWYEWREAFSRWERGRP